ncbi:MAG TPA: hypothetical protein GXZ76_03025 [Clostridiaceae bacterium]|nr:hypothetical protein [Clostridiaceae bacterium]
MNKSKIIGLAVLLVVIITVVAFLFFKPKALQKVDGYLGGEKIGLFEDEEFKSIMNKNYGLDVNYKKAGSIDMVRADKENMNYLFPASQTALELYKAEIGTPKKSEIILNTPLVLYTHANIKDKFIEHGYVVEENGSWYMDMEKFSGAIIEGKTWADIGLTELYGSVSVKTTDPTKSNSGNMFAGLIANSLNKGVVDSKEDFEQIMPDVKNFFGKMGYMDTSSHDLFEQFLKMGVGAYPIIAAYENQILEFAVSHPEDWEKIGQDIVIIYPTPTVYSSHVMIALDELGEETITALTDNKIQDLAWKKHGFRTGVSGAQDPSVFGVQGVTNQINKVMPMPDFKIMEMIIEELKNY